MMPLTAFWLVGALAAPAVQPPAPLDPNPPPPAPRGGPPVILVEQPSLPLVQLSLHFAGGPPFDPPGKAGLSELTNRMLLRGTKRRGRAELEEAIEALGTELYTSTQRYAVGVGATLLARHLPAFVALLTEILLEPAFAAEEVEKVKREMLAEVESDLDDDSSLARVWYRRLLYPDHPFGYGTHGRRDELAHLTLADVTAHYARTYTNARLVLSAAGQVERAALEALLAPLRMGMPEGDPLDWGRFPAPATPEGVQVALIDKADRSQGQIVLGHRSVDAADPDWAAVHVAMLAFGGTFTARLMQEVRVKRGLSYGAYARLATDRVGGYVVLSAAPEAKDIPETLALLMSEYQRLIDEGLSDDEIEFARGYLRNAWAFTQETAGARAAQQTQAVLLGRPRDYPERWPTLLAELTPAMVRDALKRRLSAQDLLAVIVCSAPDVRDAVAALPGVAAVTVHPYDSQ